MIEVKNLTTVEIDKKFLKKIAKTILEGEKKGSVELSIALVGSSRIRKLNKRYRRKNQVSDVLAFGGDQKSPKENKFPKGQAKIKNQKFLIFPSNKLSLGEIVICLSEVKKNAKRFNSTFEKELTLCLIHGILHLLGYDHEISNEKTQEMEQKQNHYLKICQKLIS